MSLPACLFPSLEPYNSGKMILDDLHSMYWEECGNPDGIPVLLIHGGPGAGCSPAMRQFSDPAFYRIILFDQRGSGRSTPLGEIRQNTTPLLIADMEKLRCHLGINHWLLSGGSWGSTLALVYAEHYPNHCLGLLLRGIFLCRRKEIEWFIYGMQTIFPEAWRQFANFIPRHERHNLELAYYKRIMDPDPSLHMPAARSWSQYEGSCSTLLPNPTNVKNFGEDQFALSFARMEVHYFSNNIFLPENFLLEHVNCLRSIPTIIVQGRYDIVCPIFSADDLTQRWPEAIYHIVADAGHSAFEPGIAQKLIESSEWFKTNLHTSITTENNVANKTSYS